MKKLILKLLTLITIFPGCQNHSTEQKVSTNSIEETQKDWCHEYFYLKKIENAIPNNQGKVLVHNAEEESFYITPHKVCTLHISPSWDDQFPTEIYNFPNLEYLWLGMRDIETLPLDFIQLKKLKHLDLQHSSLKSLPENIGALHNLDQLTLLGTDIEALPVSICDLRNLKKIHLGMSKIKRFPDCLKNINSLKLVIAFDEEGNLPEETLKQIEFLKKEMPGCEFSL